MDTTDFQPRLVINQRRTSVVKKYSVYKAAEDGSAQELVGTAQRKRLSHLEDVLFYTDDTRESVLLKFKEDDAAETRGWYRITDDNDNLFGSLEPVRSRVYFVWNLVDAAGNERYMVQTHNRVLAVMHRFLRNIPVIGWLTEVILVLCRYRYDIIDLASYQKVAEYRKTAVFKEDYCLASTDDVWRLMDWRVLVAVSVALDAATPR